MTSPSDTLERERMASRKRRDKRERFDAHVYMTADERAAIEEVAHRECRSVTAQIMYFVRQGLADEPSLAPKAEDITRATRKQLAAQK